MTRLRDFSWWPNTWFTENGDSHAAIDIRKNGVLTNVRRMGNELMLIMEFNGATLTANIDSHLSADFLILLRHILLQHWGETLSVVENLQLDLSPFVESTA